MCSANIWQIDSPNRGTLIHSLLMILLKWTAYCRAAHACVGDGENQTLRMLLNAQANPSGLCELEGVVDEIAQDLRDAFRVQLDPTGPA